jgi:large subunit ribosomal protein L18
MKQVKRLRRKKHIHKKVFGTKEVPRLCVYKSLKHIYAQVINDETKQTLFGCSTLTKEFKEKIKYGGNIQAGAEIGKGIAELCKKHNITKVVFDRNGFKYHGRVAALADAAREKGLIF